MNIKNLAVVVALSLAIVFLLMDKCGNSRRADELKGEYKKASEIAETEKRIKEEIIKEQNKKIEEQDLLIAKANREVEIKNDHISSLSDDVLDLELSYVTLNDKDEKINNLMKQVGAWREKFNLSQSIISDKDAIIFSLTEKYDAQIRISIEYKSMGETTRGLLAIRDKQVKELDKINKRLRFSSGLKSGFVVVLAGVIVYSLVK